MILQKVRRSISALTLSQQRESLSLASEVIKGTFFIYFFTVAAVGLWPQFIRLRKSNNRVKTTGAEES